MKWRSTVWTRRAGLLTVAALLLAGNATFLLWYRATAEDRQRGLEARRTGLEKEVTAAEAQAAVLSEQRERLSQVSSALQDFFEKRVGPRRVSLAPFVDEIHMVLWRVGVSPGQIAYAFAPVQDLPLTELNVSFSFRNDYDKFKQLLAAFESDRRWIVVREIGLSRDPDIPGGVNVRVHLATYFGSDEESRPARPKPSTARGTPE